MRAIVWDYSFVKEYIQAYRKTKGNNKVFDDIV